MTAIEVLREVRAAGGSLTPVEDGLRCRMPAEPPAALIEALRARKADLLVLLRPLELPCLACGGMYRWRDPAGAWHCGTCEPDPRAHRLRGVTLELLGNRAITLQPPTGDLGAPGSWVRTPRGTVAEVVLFEAGGAEVLLRALTGGQLGWFQPEQLSWEEDWKWSA